MKSDKVKSWSDPEWSHCHLGLSLFSIIIRDYRVRLENAGCSCLLDCSVWTKVVIIIITKALDTLNHKGLYLESIKKEIRTKVRRTYLNVKVKYTLGDELIWYKTLLFKCQCVYNSLSFKGC